MTETRRRKIFPHLDEQNKKSSSNDDNKSSTAAAAKKAADDNDETYDNAKSKTSKTGSQTKSKLGTKNTEKLKSNNRKQPQLPHQDTPHLLPLPLILTTLLCSGLFWITSFRDVMATGKPILDTLSPLLYPHQPHSDLNLLEYTKSTQWFDDSRGWKSKQGGLSTILTVTTDENNMGGLFLRKIGGVAGLAYHTSKLWPVVFSSPPRLETQGKGKGLWAGASWGAGHFDPVLAVGMVGDVCVALFYLGRMEDMGNAGAGGLGRVLVIVSLIEALVFGLFLVGRRMDRKNFGSVTKIKKTENSVVAGNDPLDNPRSLPSRIVGRTVLIVSSLIALVSVRDLFFPGTILSFLPRDDIYLEWTGAFLHSPPPDSVEADEQGLEAPLYAGDKFVSQLMGLYLCLGCLFKFVSAFGWSKGNRYMGIIAGKRVENVERSGVVSSRLIWKTQAFGDMMLLGMLRLFTPAAKTASLDLRWHLMLVAYEMFILALYGFW